MTARKPDPCPCDPRRLYRDCCAPWHGGARVPDAERLMRSRYSAYVLGLSEYLLGTWHVSTRPRSLDLTDAAGIATRWLGLGIKRHVVIDRDHAEVEFVARCRVGGQPAQRLHERSRFVREADTWFYLDGEIDPPA